MPELSSAPTLIDDFSAPNPAWARFETEENAVYALEGELYLEDRGRAVAAYSPLVGHDYQDVIVNTRIRHVQGTVDNWMGVICRQADEENYYLLVISADGYYLIARVEDGSPTPLTGPEFSEAIRRGKAQNEVEVRCRGNMLSLRVNDTLLVTRVDDAFDGSGQVALFADAVEGRETTLVAFDNFVLTVP
jgi:hypothetical protein